MNSKFFNKTTRSLLANNDLAVIYFVASFYQAKHDSVRQSML